MVKMVRTQIQLTKEQSRILKDIASKKGVSVAELIRQSVDDYIRSTNEPSLEEKYRRALAIAGKYSTEETDISRNHDRYLDEIYGDFGE
jgi:hypothetical protein